MCPVFESILTLRWGLEGFCGSVIFSTEFFLSLFLVLHFFFRVQWSRLARRASPYVAG
jgi:hypothetical protein